MTLLDDARSEGTVGASAASGATSDASDASDATSRPSPLTIEAVTSPAPRDAWTRIVEDDPASMADHTPAWTDAITRTSPHRDVSRLYELSDGRRFVLPLVERRGVGRMAGLSGSMPEGWGFGGLVGRGQDPSAVRLVLDDLGRRRHVFTRLRPDPLSADLWAAGAPPGVVTTPKRAHVLDLSPGIEALRAAMHPSARRALRKAEKAGLRVECEASGRLLEDYYHLYERSLERWATTSHEPVWLARWRGRRRDSLAKLETMAECLGDRFRLYLAYVDDVPAAGQIVLFGNAAHDTRGAMDKGLASPTRANFLIQWRAIEDAAAAGCRVLHLGESGSSVSLARYKEHYGARSVEYCDLRVERLPVTRVDRALRSAVKTAIGFRED